MTRRRWIIAHVIGILLIAYVSSYFYISRLRMEQWKPMKIMGFLYVSPESMANDPDEHWRVRDGLLNLFYTPINRLDRVVFNTPSPDVCILTGIGPKKR